MSSAMPLSPGLVWTLFIGQQRRQTGTGKTIRRKEQSEPVQVLERAGCLFLPPARRRHGSRPENPKQSMFVAGGPSLQLQICQIDLVAFPESRYSRAGVCWDEARKACRHPERFLEGQQGYN